MAEALESAASAAPATEPPTGVINCAAYAGGKRVATVEVDDLGSVVAPPDEFVWLGLYEPSEELLQKVQRAARAARPCHRAAASDGRAGRTGAAELNRRW